MRASATGNNLGGATAEAPAGSQIGAAELSPPSVASSQGVAGADVEELSSSSWSDDAGMRVTASCSHKGRITAEAQRGKKTAARNASVESARTSSARALLCAEPTCRGNRGPIL